MDCKIHDPNLVEFPERGLRIFRHSGHVDFAATVRSLYGLDRLNEVCPVYEIAGDGARQVILRGEVVYFESKECTCSYAYRHGTALLVTGRFLDHDCPVHGKVARLRRAQLAEHRGPILRGFIDPAPKGFEVPFPDDIVSDLVAAVREEPVRLMPPRAKQAAGKALEVSDMVVQMEIVPVPGKFIEGLSGAFDGDPPGPEELLTIQDGKLVAACICAPGQRARGCPVHDVAPPPEVSDEAWQRLRRAYGGYRTPSKSSKEDLVCLVAEKLPRLEVRAENEQRRANRLADRLTEAEEKLREVRASRDEWREYAEKIERSKSR